MHNLNQYSYSRERRRFGRHCNFSDITQYMFNIQPSIKRRLNYVLRNPIDRSTQLSSQMAFSEVETENPDFAEHGMFHYEGGWPKEININDEEATLRYRKKIEREDEWGPQVVRLIEQSMVVASQNSAVNIYYDFFLDLPPDVGANIRRTFKSRPCNIFHDPVQPARRVSIIDWCPGDPNSFLVQHTDLLAQARTVDYEETVEVESDIVSHTTHGSVRSGGQADLHNKLGRNSFFVWDLENPLRPKILLNAPEVVRRAVYCPKDDNFIAGGLQAGTVCTWDAKNGGYPLQLTPLETSHREPVSAICWVHSKTNTEFYTGSWDGAVKYWDFVRLETPTLEVLLDPTGTDEQRRDRAHGVSVLEFEYTIPVRFIIGSDHGHVFIGNRKGTTPLDILPNNYKLMSGLVRTIERNPFFVKNFLICGDWCAKIWAEECKGFPSTFTFKRKNEILCGTWSTSRCSMFVTGDNQGNLDFWDLLLNQREPIFSMKFPSLIINAKFRPDGEFLAVALDNGDAYLLELDAAMRHSNSRDKALIAALFEREQLRCRLLEGRVEEIKLKQGLLEKDQEEVESAPEEEEEILDPKNPAQFLRIIEKDLEYRDIVRIFNEVIFAVDKKRQEHKYRMERTDFEEYIDAAELQQAVVEEEPVEEEKKPKAKEAGKKKK